MRYIPPKFVLLVSFSSIVKPIMCCHRKRKYLWKMMSKSHTVQTTRDDFSDEEDSLTISRISLWSRIGCKPGADKGKHNDQNYEIPLGSPNVPVDEDIDIFEMKDKVGLCFTPNPKLRKPVPKLHRNLTVSVQQHVENCLVIMTDKG